MTDLASRVAALEADLATSKANYNESLDTIWMLLAALLVFFMHAGFSLLEAGSVRFKSAQNILAKNLVVVTVGFLCWWATGYAFALGSIEDPGKFAGSTNFFMDGFWDNKALFRAWFFQGAFCATSATIVSGAMAERTQLKGFGLFTVLMTAFIYPVVVYWGWSGNGIFNYADDDGKSVSIFGPAYIDFAGSGIVHMVGGVGALCGAIIVGPRKGRFETDDVTKFAPHSIPFCVLGTFCLWFGWYGFNPGSTGSMHDVATATTAGLVAVNTTLAPCAAGLLVFFLRANLVAPKRLDVSGFCNGILAGLVAITAGCSTMKPWEAILIGLIGGLVYQSASIAIARMQIDDVVDAFAVHGATGLWGVVACGVFGNPDESAGGNGLLYSGDQLRTQVLAALFIAVWVGALCIAILLPLKLAGILRMGDVLQDSGADATEHNPTKAYSTEAVEPAKLTETGAVSGNAEVEKLGQCPV